MKGVPPFRYNRPKKGKESAVRTGRGTPLEGLNPHESAAGGKGIWTCGKRVEMARCFECVGEMVVEHEGAVK